MWAIDLPGFGDSDVPDFEWYTTERYTDHVYAFCNKLGITPYTIIGHSLGARITVDMAKRYPHMLQRMVLTSPPITGKLGFNIDIALVPAFVYVLKTLSEHIWPLATAGALSTYWAPRFLGSEAVKRTAKDMRRSSWQAGVGSLRAVTDHDYSSCLPDLAQPALVISGAKDYTIPPGDARLAAKLLQNGELLIMDRVHHWPADEASELFQDALDTFLLDGRGNIDE
jgi:N-formylmaleamate deformylase